MTVATTTLRVDFISESAAYENTFGWYNKVTGYGGILFADVEAEGAHAPLTPGVSSTTFTVNTADLANIQFFLVPDGYNINRNDSDDFTGQVKVIQLSDGTWAVADVDSHGNVATDHGKPDILSGAGANALFTETSKNAGNVDYASSVVGSNQTAATLAGDTADGATGQIAWEDLAATRNKNGTYSKPGDADYNDAVFRVTALNANAAPVANADAITVSEDAGATTINVLANDTDPNAGDTLHVTAVNTTGILGTVTIAAGGASINYTPAASFQSLRAGETRTETFSYTVADQAGLTSTANVTVTITGANDGPTAVADTASATESGGANNGTPGVNPTGNVLTNDTDPDAGDTKTVIAVAGSGTNVGAAIAGTHGTLTLNADGSYSYVVNNSDAAVEALRTAANTLTDTFTYTMKDTAGATASSSLTVTIHGANDGPVAVADTNAADAVVESGVNPGNTPFAGDASAAGNVLTNDTDVDAGDTRTVTTVGTFTGTFGTLTLNINGSYSYVLNNNAAATNALALGETHADVFNYTIADELGATSTSTLTINVQGTNDAPLITGGNTMGTIQEDTTQPITGHLNVTDPDHGATQTWTVGGGTSSHPASYHFALDDFKITRNGNAWFEDSFSDNAAPPSLHNDVVVNGATVSQYGTSIGATFTESGGRAIMDSATAGDVLNVGTPDPFEGQVANLLTNAIDADMVQGLKENMTFAVEGRFDLAIPGDLREAYGIGLNDRLVGGNGTPPDQLGDDNLQLVVRDGVDGIVRVQFRDFNYVANTVTNIQSSTLNVLPGDTQIVLRLSHTIAGSDAITASFDMLNALGNVTHTETFSIQGHIFTDELWTRAQFLSYAPKQADSVINGQYGTLSVDQSGTWNYTLANDRANTQALAAGQTAVENFSAVVTDDHGATATQPVTITVTGTNDAPTIVSGPAARNVIEIADGAANENTAVDSATGKVAFLDVDLTDAHTPAVTPAGSGYLGNFSVAYNGIDDHDTTGGVPGSVTWNYSVNDSALDYLGQNQTLTQVYSVAINDGHGGIASQNVTINLVGTNDAPTAITLSNASVTENSAINTVVGALSTTDADASDTFTYTLTDNAGGRFGISGSNLVVGAAPIDYETATQHNVIVRVTDSAGAFYDKPFTIGVDNVFGVIDGTDGPDILTGTSEEDTIHLLAGDDQILAGGGNDFIDGGLGTDRASYEDATGGITVDLRAGTVTGPGVGTDTLRSIEFIKGSNYVDNYTAAGFGGSPLDPNVGSNGTLNQFEGLGGDDIITGNGNTRVSYQSATAGVIVDLAGTATGDLSVGTDHFTGVNAVRGSNYDDTLKGTGANENFEGRGGTDLIDGGAGSDLAVYNRDTTTTSGIQVFMAAGTVIGDGTVGTDTLRSIENVAGTNFDDTYDGTGFGGIGALNIGNNGTFNQFEGYGGNDNITGPDTQASYFNATAAVNVNLTTGIATGDASVGTDHLINIYRVQGSNGFGDTLIGNNQSNIIAGLGGDDFIDGGGNTGGGSGAGDRSDYRNATGGIDVKLAIGTVDGDASVGHDTLRSVEGIIGSNSNDTYNAVGFSASSTNAGSLTFFHYGTNGEFNQFEGMGGNDIITGNGFTELDFFGATAGVTVNIAAGNSTGNSSVGTDTFTGVNAVNASAFDDTIIGDSNSNWLEGRGGSDTIFGGAGNDNLYGESAGGVDVAGNDTLAGGTGTDFLMGGGGNDTFIYGDGDGADTIGDFTAGAGAGDRIDLTVVSRIYTLSDVLAHATSDAGGTTIDFGGGNSIRLQGVQAVQLNADDFVFNPGQHIVGDANNNTLNGTTFGDWIEGLGGDDTLTGGTGNDFLDGGLGVDLATYSNAVGAITVDMAAGTVSGGGLGNDTLVGIEKVQGGSSADSYNAVGFNAGTFPQPGTSPDFNEFEGMGGDDTITGNGATRISYLNAAAGVTVNVASGTGQGTAPADVAGVGLDHFSGVSAVRGSNFIDNLTGSDTNGNLAENLEGRGGNDIINGGLGFDRAIYNNDSATTSGITVTLNGFTYQVFGDSTIGTDTLTSIESIRGTNFVDTYTATSTFSGSNGTFNEFEGMGGNDQINGNGNTRITYLNATGGVTADMILGTVVGDQSVGTDHFNNVTQIRGSTFDDFLYGSNNSNTSTETFEGWNGNDWIDGRGGFDMAVYANTFSGTPFSSLGISVDMANGIVTGRDATATAIMGADTLRGVESIRGTNADDIYNAGALTTGSLNAGNAGATSTGLTFNEFEGMGGNDTITGNGNTRLSYQSALAAVTVNLALGTASGTDVGTDTITGGVNAVRGGAGNDTLIGSASNETFEGFGGNDTIDGAGGFDLARYDNNGFGGVGGINVNMATGAVASFGAAVGVIGTDTLLSIEGVRGTNNNDTYNATGFSSSSVNAGSNGTYNEFEGMNGNDQITGNGNTLISYQNAGGGVVVNLSAPTVAIPGSTGIASGGAGSDTIFGGVNGVRGSQSNDTITGSFGNDFLDGQGGVDTVSYLAATSGVSVDIAAGTASGGMGTDTLSQFESIIGSNFDDMLIGTSGSNTLTGNDGNDIFRGQGGNDTIDGGNGIDTARYLNPYANYTLTHGATALTVTDLTAGPNNDGTDTVLNNVELLQFSDALVVNFDGSTLPNHYLDISSAALPNGLPIFGTGGGNQLAVGTNVNGHAVDLTSFSTLYLTEFGTPNYTLNLQHVDQVYGIGGIENVTLTQGTGNGFLINLGSGFDTLNLSNSNNDLMATFVEFLYGGAGDDTVLFQPDQSLVNQIVDLGGGTNVLNMVSGTFSMFISGSNLTVNDASIAGDVDMNLLNVQSGTTFNFGAGNDSLNLASDFGNPLATNVVTVIGVDTVTGSSNNDNITIANAAGTTTTVTAGWGADTLTASAGDDHFRFTSIADSQGASTITDTITNFDGDHDQFVFSGMSGSFESSTIEFIGTAAFDSSHGSQARLDDQGGGNAMLQIDIDGDGVIGANDMQVHLNSFTGTLHDGTFIVS